MKAKRIGDVITVKNKDRKFGSALEYAYVRVQFEDGTEKPLLFTTAQIDEAKVRAEVNSEDLPKVGWFKNILD
jgi:hypothetical protein